jgi:hypothetical protein
VKRQEEGIVHDVETSIKERRQSVRWPTSIPCTVLWEDRVISGEMANISFRGALIAGPSASPPVDSAVTLVFHYHCKVELTARVDSVVIHQSVEAADTGGLGGFGLKFQESLDQIQPKLQPLIEKLGGESFPAQDLDT